MLHVAVCFSTCAVDSMSVCKVVDISGTESLSFLHLFSLSFISSLFPSSLLSFLHLFSLCFTTSSCQSPNLNLFPFFVSLFRIMSAISNPLILITLFHVSCASLKSCECKKFARLKCTRLKCRSTKVYTT